MRAYPLLCAVIFSALSACGQSADTPAVTEARELAAAAPSAPLPPPRAPVDTCAMLSQADAEKLMGPLDSPPTAGQPQGSLLGECRYAKFSDGKMLTVSARPAGEFQRTLEYAVQKGPNVPIDGLGESARITRAGLMFQPAGKPYFVVVLGVGLDDATVTAAARALQL